MKPFAPHRSFTVSVALVTALVAGGCSSLDRTFQGDKVDYRGKSTRTNSLEVPPDLTQLARDGRYAPQASGSVSASTFQTAAGGTVAAAAVAPSTLADFRIMRNGNQRWLVSTLTPEQLWPAVRSFWEEQGFELTVSNPEVGVMETSWAENRAKLGNDWFRSTIGLVLESLYATGERDKYRTRIERAQGTTGTEIYVSHFGMQEVYTTAQSDRTSWTARANDPQLEAELLQRMMVRLGSKPEAAKAAVAAASSAPGVARARLLTGQPTATLQMDENFDRAWRRVGLALDRNGFTVEDRDRSSGTYFVRYADPRAAGQEDPGFFSRLFGASAQGTPGRYRVSVKADGERSTVSVFNSQGTPENGEIGQRIAQLLLDELR